MGKKKPRSYGDGSTYAYQTKAGTRFRWQATIQTVNHIGVLENKRVGNGGFLLKIDAFNAMQNALRDNREGKAFSIENPTFERFALDWLDSQVIANATRKGYQKILRVHLIPHLGDLKLKEIHSTTVAKLYRSLKQHGNQGRLTKGGPLTYNTVNKIHIVLGAVMQEAFISGLVPLNQVRHNPKFIKAPTRKHILMEQKPVQPWNAKQAKEFLTWSKDVYKDDLYPLWHLFLHTGIRRGEGVALKWSDINFDTGSIQIERATDSALRKAVKNTKTNKVRPVLVSREVLDVLRAHKMMRAQLGLSFVKPDAFVFGTLDGTVRNAGDVGQRWSTSLAHALEQIEDLTHLTIKGLRHTHATLMLQGGAQPKTIQERLGHSDIGTTMDIYSHVTKTMQAEAVQAFDRLIERA
jgi:integrase